MAAIQALPLFPLGLVLYPEETLPLHIFEPRYQEMIAYCRAGRQPFGVVNFHDGKMAEVGCTARIKRILKLHDDGRLDLLAEGRQRFKVARIYQDKAYLTADVDTFSEERGAVKKKLQQRVITQHTKLLELAGRTPQQALYQDVQQISYFVAQNAGLSVDQKQQLLELPAENERLQFLADHLEAFIPKVEGIEEVRRKVRTNGHLKDFPLPDV